MADISIYNQHYDQLSSFPSLPTLYANRVLVCLAEVEVGCSLSGVICVIPYGKWLVALCSFELGLL